MCGPIRQWLFRLSDGYLLTGHKFFCSAPMCDAFLVLGQYRRYGDQLVSLCRAGGPMVHP